MDIVYLSVEESKIRREINVCLKASLIVDF